MKTLQVMEVCYANEKISVSLSFEVVPIAPNNKDVFFC